MKESMIIREEVHFNAAADKVWDLLTNPAMTKQYMFGCELLSDWQIGSPIYWKGKTENGEEVIYVKGQVVAYEERKKISTTTFDPNSGMADIPENYVQLTYELKTVEEGTMLTIIQGDFSGAEEGKKRYEESKHGWSGIVIPAMQQLLKE